MYNQKVAVDTGYWQLYRFNPSLAKEGKNPLHLDSKPPKLPLKEFMNLETRFKMLTKSHPDRAKQLAIFAQEDVSLKWKMLEHLAEESEVKIAEITKNN